MSPIRNEIVYLLSLSLKLATGLTRTARRSLGWPQFRCSVPHVTCGYCIRQCGATRIFPSSSALGKGLEQKCPLGRKEKTKMVATRETRSSLEVVTTIFWSLSPTEVTVTYRSLSIKVLSCKMGMTYILQDKNYV